MRKLICIWLAVGSLAVLGSPASAQVYGQFTGAETVPSGGRMFGAYVLSSANVVGLLSQLRLSFYPNIDFGFYGGLARQDFNGGNRTTVRLGTGIKVKVADPTDQLPIAIAIGGDLGIETGDNFHVLTIGPSIVASRTFPLGQNGAITPYGRLGLAISSIDVGPLNDNDIAVPIRLGSDFRITPQVHLVAELQVQVSDSFNDDLGVAAGVNIPF